MWILLIDWEYFRLNCIPVLAQQCLPGGGQQNISLTYLSIWYQALMAESSRTLAAFAA